MPAALTIAPSGTVTVKTTSDPAAPAEGTAGFGQVLRSVCGVAQGQPAPADPDLAAAAVEEAATGRAASAEKAATPHVAVPAAKSSHTGKEDRRADVDPGVSSCNAAVVPGADAVVTPAVAETTVPAAMVPPASAPVVAGDDQPAPVRAASIMTGSDGSGTRVQGAVPSRPAKAPVSKEKVSTKAAAAPVATPAGAVQTQVNPVDATAAARAPAGLTGRDADSPDGVVAGGAAPSAPVPPSSGSGDQVGSATGDPNMPAQPVLGAGSDVLGPLAVPAPVPPRQTPSSAATEAASPAVPGGDHKVTLRPVEAGADPAKPTVPSGSVQQPVAVAAWSAATPAAATPTAAVAVAHQAVLASPVQQLAPALLTLVKTADGGQQMTVRLHPADLGMVQVRIAQVASGATQVDITADNPATLLALQRDQPQLHRALDDAGIAAAGRTVTFHVAQPAQAVAGADAPAPANSHGTNQQGSAGRANAGTTDADGSAGGGRGNYAARERTAYPAGRRSDAPAAATGTAGGTARTSYRIGLDITA